MPEERTILEGATDVLNNEGIAAGLKYPIRGHRFTVQLDKLGLMSFKSVEGFRAELGTVEYREGAYASIAMRKLPGMVTYGDITLTKGMYNNLALYNYFMTYLNGKETGVCNMIIKAFDNADLVTAQWTVLNAWPTSYESGGLSADSAEVLIETVVFANEGVFRDTV